MGGKGQLPNPAFEPYQCCPRPPAGGSKVAKLQPKIKQVTGKTAPKAVKKIDKPAPAPMKTVSKANHPLPPRPGSKDVKNGKEKAPLAKGEKGKGKKGFFGTGKYIWWW